VSRSLSDLLWYLLFLSFCFVAMVYNSEDTSKEEPKEEQKEEPKGEQKEEQKEEPKEEPKEEQKEEQNVQLLASEIDRLVGSAVAEAEEKVFSRSNSMVKQSEKENEEVAVVEENTMDATTMEPALPTPNEPKEVKQEEPPPAQQSPAVEEQPPRAEAETVQEPPTPEEPPTTPEEPTAAPEEPAAAEKPAAVASSVVNAEDASTEDASTVIADLGLENELAAAVAAAEEEEEEDFDALMMS
jgi:hypothetical protein